MADTSDMGGIMAVRSIADEAYYVASFASQQRDGIMGRISNAVASSSTEITLPLDNVDTKVDIASGAGALLLDDYLQELSTVEQAAAQFVAAENKAQKQIHSVTGQG